MSTGEQGAPAIEKDRVYGTGGGRELRCDVHRPPAGAGNGMALVFFHGGGFTGGSKDAVVARVGYYAAIGYTCVAAEYRLAQEAKWPAQIEDAKACIRWTRANAASLDVDPDKIGVAGFSAGGMLALSRPATGGSPITRAREATRASTRRCLRASRTTRPRASLPSRTAPSTR